MTRFVAFTFPLLLMACAGPTRWSADVFAKLQCGMSEADVSALSEGRLQKQSGASPNGTTHIVFDQSAFQYTTYIRIAMPDGRVERADLCWDYKMMAVACATAPRLRCERNGA